MWLGKLKLTNLLVAIFAVSLGDDAQGEAVPPGLQVAYLQTRPVGIQTRPDGLQTRPDRSTVKVHLKTLILSGQELLLSLPISIIDRSGGSYDTFVLKPNSDTVPLYDVNGNGLYNSIVITDIDCAAWDPSTGLWPSGFSKKFLQDLETYRLKFNVRMVYLKSSINADDSLVSKNPLEVSGNDGTSELAYLKFVNDSNIVPSIKSNLNSDMYLKVGRETPFQPPSLRYFWGKFDIDPSKNQDKHLTAIMQICSLETQSTDPCSLGAFIRTEPNGLQSLHFSFTADIYTLHGLVVGDMWYGWVTQGLFLGERRIILNTHVDDVFLQTGVYNVAENRQYDDRIDGQLDDDDPKIYRLSGDDVTYLVQWQNRFRAKLSAGSNFTIEMCFNGNGFNNTRMSAPYNSWAQEPRWLAVRDNFLWVSHTWNHIDMYCVESDCTPPDTPFVPPKCFFNNITSPCDYTPVGGFAETDDAKWFLNEPKYPPSGYTPYEMIVYECTKNTWWAHNSLFPDRSIEDLFNSSRTPNFSPHGIVTPRISGLNYTEAIEAMLDSNIQYAVGDNSRPELCSFPNKYHMLDAPITLVGGGKTMDQVNQLSDYFKVIPRFATRVYFDCATPEQLVEEHNAIYGPDCVGNDLNEPILPPLVRCNTSSFKYDKKLTIDEMMYVESRDVAVNILKYRHDPYMFHQGNLHFFNYKRETTEMGGRITFPNDNTKKSCLLCLWLDYVADYVTKYNTLPILTMKLGDLHDRYIEREERDACNITGLLQYSFAKNAAGILESSLSNLKISSNGQCEPKVTMTYTAFDSGYESAYKKIVNSQVLASVNGYSIDKYGVDNTITFHGKNANNTLYYFF